MLLNERLTTLAALGEVIKRRPDKLKSSIHQAYLHNQWFTPENTEKALDTIADEFLALPKLENWLAAYEVPPTTQSKKVGLIMAGNIPLVGFHDFLCTFVTGHFSLIKPSEKDSVLLKTLLEFMIEINPNVQQVFEITDRLKGFDAVIATGSNNTARYFETYFNHVPNIIRKNKHSVAILTGKELNEELEELGKDVFTYFGLGCRNVSKLYVPEGYNFDDLGAAFHVFKEIQLHNKYKNNYDYNYTLLSMNRVPHISFTSVILQEQTLIASRIAQLNYEYYKNEKDLTQKILSNEAEIQCIVAKDKYEFIATVPFGQAQHPSLFDYADGVDTLKFLCSLD